MGIKHKLERGLYRTYRAVKRFYLETPSAPLRGLFFQALRGMNRNLSHKHTSPVDSAAKAAWKACYFTRFPRSNFVLQSGNVVAIGSADHKWPRGAIHDSSVNRRFNLKVYDYFARKPTLSLLDLGCAGGGLVKSFLEDGYTAIGLEGSSAPQKLRLAEWDTIPHHLFTCDITEPFGIQSADGKPVKFDVITAWEVLEHIPEAKIPALVRNISDHLNPGGLFIGSVDQAPDGDPTVGAVYHVTSKPKPWWLDQFAGAGLTEASDHPFTIRDFVRGHGRGLKDWDARDGEGFHLVMTNGSGPGCDELKMVASPASNGGKAG